jgi:signal transduction histidine kinase
VALGRLQTSLAELDRFARSYIIDGTAEQRAAIDSSLHQARMQLNNLRSYPKEVATAEQSIDAVDQSMRNVISYMSSGRKEAATTYFDRVKPQLAAVQHAMDDIAAAIDKRSQADDEVAGRISGAARTTTLASLLLSFAVVMALGYWTTYAVITPVRRLRRAMASVAAGEFVVPEDLPYRRQDEIGDLARSFSWMTEHLARLDKMKAEFISIATHELKTPINVIGGYAELVEEGLYGPVSLDQRNALHAIREQSQVLTRLVNQLLDISRLEAGGLELQMGSVHVEELLESLERSFGILARQKNIVMYVEVDKTVPRSIQGDADRLRDQVLGNLLSNALKFTGENGRVAVRAWGNGDTLELEVTDSGVGIPKEKVPFVFDKFYQIGQQARTKGAGLGLAIAREVVEAHGGRIWVESTPNVGTTFRVSLPMVQTDEPHVAEEPVEAAVAEGNG